MLELSHLSPVDFEEFCYDLLTAIGFSCNRFKGTNSSVASVADRGRDILAKRRVEDKQFLRSWTEEWCVEVKHYIKPIAVDDFRTNLLWASAMNIRRLFIICSGFLSNDAKDFINIYQDSEPINIIYRGNKNLEER